MWILFKIKKPNRKNLILSIALSISLHFLSIHFASRYSLWFAAPSHPKEAACSIEKLHRDEILKEVFTQNSATSAKSKLGPILETNPILLKSLVKNEHVLPLKAPPHSNKIDPSSAENQLLSSAPSISFSPLATERFDLFEHLPKDLIIPAPPLPTYPLPLLSQMKEPTFHSDHFSPPPMEMLLKNQPSPETSLLSLPSLREAFPHPKPPLLTPLPPLPQLPSLAQLKTVSYSDEFDAEISFVPKEDGDGYIFALTLIARPNLHLPKIKQNYTFLIDRSNSVQKERLLAMKNAVYKALEELDPNDSFNIIAFDHKVDKLSPSSLSNSSESLKFAKAFLDRLELGSFFSSSYLFKPLFLTIPSHVKEDELHTAILLTDGELLNKKGAQKSLLYEWTSNNCGRVSLFALGIGGDPHLSSLELGVAFNKGTMVHSPTKGGIKRKLLKLMKNIEHPIAKDLSYRAIYPQEDTQIAFATKPNQISHLYLNEPYVILGTTKTLDPFILFIQGRLKDKCIHIKKKISFLHAKKGNSSLKMEWALKKSYKLYDDYLHENNPVYLKEAQDLLEAYNLQVSFE
jgi:hypothetical protein